MVPARVFAAAAALRRQAQASGARNVHSVPAFFTCASAPAPAQGIAVPVLVMNRSRAHVGNCAAYPCAQATRRMATSAKSAKSSLKNADDQLSASLAKEETYEDEATESAGAEEQPECLRNLMSQETFKIKDVAGSSEVILQRELGSELITVTFSIDDVNTGLNEDEANEAFNGEYAKDDDYDTVSLVVTVTKPGGEPGALTFQGVAEAHGLTISNVVHTEDTEAATATTAEADYRRRGMYMGPGFDTLDDDMQSAFTEYLSARGVDDDLATAIVMYAKRKEYREYRKWLSSVRRFVKA